MNKHIKNLVLYGIENNLLSKYEYDYAINKLCDLLQLTTYKDEETILPNVEEPSLLLTPLLDHAASQNIISPNTTLNRDIFEAKIMDIIIPRPHTVIEKFNHLYKENKQKATNYYYNLSKKSNYIKTSRTNKNIIWKSSTPYGMFDMTINLSKPEKDPRDIIASKNNTQSNYPKCLLCKEHVGYFGAPGRTNHRIIPIKLNNENFYLQYSPYVYYNEHNIVFSEDHSPMNVTEKTFKRLTDFVDMFPHYFLGSNAGLPIVGGSILSHEHYQGGNYHFPIEDAEILSESTINEITIKKLKWPLSVVRLESTNKQSIINAAIKLYDYFKEYTNTEEGILAYTDQPHNAITPIVRKNKETYVIDMTLRNNRTSKEYPLGIFHPHDEVHHIKKENIGLIEVMGLAVLPSRLENELEVIKEAVLSKTSLPIENIHHDFVNNLLTFYNNEDIDTFINEQVTLVFTKCLEHAGIFKQTTNSQKAFDQFIRGYKDVLRRN